MSFARPIPRPLRSPVLTGLALAAWLASGGAAAAADAPSGATLQSDDRAALVELLAATHARTLELVRGLDERQWGRKPEQGGWSVGEVVEHLVLAESAVRGRVEALLEAGPRDDWKTLERVPLARLVELGSDRSRKFEAPEPIQPRGETSRAILLQRLMTARADSIHWVLETEAPLQAVAAEAPIGVVLDGRGWVGLLGAHTLRHNRQLEEIRAALALE